MPIAAQWADVWHSYGPPEVMREKSARLSRMALERGRDPIEITRASSLSLEDDMRPTVYFALSQRPTATAFAGACSANVGVPLGGCPGCLTV